MMRKIHKGEIKALVSLCFNPKVSLPDNNYVGEALDKLEFMASIDFFMSETARHADIVLPGSLQEEDEGIITQIEGRIIKVNKAVECPGDAREDWKILQDIAAALDRPKGFTFQSPVEILDELRRASSGGTADYAGVTYEKVEENGGLFGRVLRMTIQARHGCLNQVLGIPWRKELVRFTSPMAKPAWWWRRTATQLK